MVEAGARCACHAAMGPPCGGRIRRKRSPKGTVRGTRAGRVPVVFACSTGRKQRVTGLQFAHGQTAPVSRSWESRSKGYTAFLRR